MSHLITRIEALERIVNAVKTVLIRLPGVRAEMQNAPWLGAPKFKASRMAKYAVKTQFPPLATPTVNNAPC